MSTAQSSGAPSTTDVARDQASQVGQSAGGAAAHVAQHSKEQIGEVAAEAQRQARDLLGEARTQVSQQAGTQRDRLTEALMSLSAELEEMADKGGQGGIASEIARQASQRITSVAGSIEGREPADLLGDLRSYARQRPTVFLVGALAAGVVAGRLTRGIRDENADSAGSTPPALPAGRSATTPALGTPALGTTNPYVAPVPAEPVAPPVVAPTAAPVPGGSMTPPVMSRDDFGRRADGGV